MLNDVPAFFHSLDWGYYGSNYFETFTVVYSLNLNYFFYIFWSKGGGANSDIGPPLQNVGGHWPPRWRRPCRYGTVKYIP